MPIFPPVRTLFILSPKFYQHCLYRLLKMSRYILSDKYICLSGRCISPVRYLRKHLSTRTSQLLKYVIIIIISPQVSFLGHHPPEYLRTNRRQIFQLFQLQKVLTYGYLLVGYFAGDVFRIKDRGALISDTKFKERVSCPSSPTYGTSNPNSPRRNDISLFYFIDLLYESYNLGDSPNLPGSCVYP